MSEQRTRLDEIISKGEALYADDIDPLVALAVACRDAQEDLADMATHMDSQGFQQWPQSVLDILTALQPLLELQPAPGAGPDTGDKGE